MSDEEGLDDATVAWAVYAWTCPYCQEVNVIMDPAGPGDYGCDGCGEFTNVEGVE